MLIKLPSKTFVFIHINYCCYNFYSWREGSFSPPIASVLQILITSPVIKNKEPLQWHSGPMLIHKWKKNNHLLMSSLPKLEKHYRRWHAKQVRMRREGEILCSFFHQIKAFLPWERTFKFRTLEVNQLTRPRKFLKLARYRRSLLKIIKIVTAVAEKDSPVD